jgi:hypothetical protein
MKELEEKCNFFLEKIRDFSEASNKEEQKRVYEETQIQTEELEKNQAENRNKEQQEQQEQQKLDDKSQNDEKTNPHNQTNNPSPGKEQKTSNNPLPSPSEIQNNYNSDKDKSEIDNSSDLTNPEQKNQANELLKIVISAELLIKKKQFNPEILTKLLEVKKKDNSLYQVLNKEGRIDKVITQLERIKQLQKDSNKSVSNNQNQQNNQITTKIVVGIVILLALLGLGITVLVRKKKRRKVKH